MSLPTRFEEYKQVALVVVDVAKGVGMEMSIHPTSLHIISMRTSAPGSAREMASILRTVMSEVIVNAHLDKEKLTAVYNMLNIYRRTILLSMHTGTAH